MDTEPQHHTEARNPADLLSMDHDAEKPYNANPYLRLASFRFRAGETTAPVLWLSEVESNLN